MTKLKQGFRASGGKSSKRYGRKKRSVQRASARV